MSPHKWPGQKRWELEEVDSHELYDLGHLYEAAVAYCQATGKRTPDVALRTADLLDRTFGPGKQTIWPGQITEMASSLYRDRRSALPEPRPVLALTRGPTAARTPAHNQSAFPCSAERGHGHAVREPMYSGMADVAALTGADGYVAALGRICRTSGHQLYSRRIGAMSNGGGFGGSYELPNMSA